MDEFVRKLDKKLAAPWPTRISLRHMKGIILVAATAIVLSALLAVNSAAGNDNAPQNGEDLERECDSQLGSVSLIRIIREGAESGVWGDEIAPKMIVAA